MAKKRLRQDFELAIQRLSLQQLKKLAALFHKTKPADATREAFLNLLMSTMDRQEQLRAMREFVLAGQGSMTIVKLDDSADAGSGIEVGFNRATSNPQIVFMGEEGELFPGYQHIQWAMVTGSVTYLNTNLVYTQDTQAAVIESLWDIERGLLQIRASADVARKVYSEWARMHETDRDHVTRLGLRDIDQAHRFYARIGAVVDSTKGNRINSQGIQKASGTRNPEFLTLVGTPDYTKFCDEHVITDTHVAFEFDGSLVKLGFGFETVSTWFVNLVDERVYQHVYTELLDFLEEENARGAP